MVNPVSGSAPLPSSADTTVSSTDPRPAGRVADESSGAIHAGETSTGSSESHNGDPSLGYLMAQAAYNEGKQRSLALAHMHASPLAYLGTT
jgi:hypothetical protein